MEKQDTFRLFHSSFNDELFSKVKRLDQLLGRDHWLSVGNYKESLLRAVLRNVLPKKWEVSTGFIMSVDRDSNPVKSKQIDIIIWDSANKSPIFRDGEFVIVPPEACGAVIEVKGKLNHTELAKSLKNFDKIMDFIKLEYQIHRNIRKYIFAYDISQQLRFPKSIWQTIAKTYTTSDQISFKERIEISGHHDLIEHGWSLFSVDAIFILSKGAMIRDRIGGKKGPRLLYNAYSTLDDSINHTYAFFEYDLQSHLSNDRFQGLWYMDQPGLLSTKNSIVIKPTEPEFVMFLPPYSKNEKIYRDIKHNQIYYPKSIDYKY